MYKVLAQVASWCPLSVLRQAAQQVHVASTKCSLMETHAIRQQHMHMLGAAQLARMLFMGAAGLAEYKLVDLQSRPGPSCRVGA